MIGFVRLCSKRRRLTGSDDRGAQQVTPYVSERQVFQVLDKLRLTAAGTDGLPAGALKLQELTMQEWTMTEKVAGVDFAGVDIDGESCRGGHCRSGQ